MSTILQLHDNIQQKIAAVRELSAILHETFDALPETCLHDANNVRKLREHAARATSTMDNYCINAEILTALATRDRGVRPFRRHLNIYNDMLHLVSPSGADSQLSHSDILELKEIYYATYYNLPSYIAGYAPQALRKEARQPKTAPSFITSSLCMSLNTFRQFVVRSNVMEDMDALVRSSEHFMTAYKLPACPQLRKLFTSSLSKYKAYGVDHRVDEDTYDVCECGTKMVIQSNSSEMMCLRCGMMTSLIGSVTEESQLFAQEGNRVAHGSYDPSRHCKFWIERIQAKESTVIPEAHINKIKESIRKDRIANLKNISVKQFRMYLKQNELSKLNDHIPLIKKIITGYIPPQLTHMEMQLLFIYFDKATKTYEAIKPNNKKNSLYYPFLIYKILDIIVADEAKKRGLLSSIHLQSYETLVENDTIWQQICNENTCFEYRPTQR